MPRHLYISPGYWLKALAIEVRNVILKSDISSFAILVLAEITGPQSGTF